MKKLLILAAIISCALPSIAQTMDSDSLNTEQVTEIVFVKDDPDTLSDGENVYEAVDAEDIPQFPGGTKALYTFIGNNIKYPAEAAEAGVQGRVILRFIVKADGSIGKTEVVKSVHPALDAEAERIVKLMPKWTPGKSNGVPVNVWFTLPVSFKLQGDVPDTPTLSERDQTDFDYLLSLGNQALSEGNTNHAYQYYKECFNIKPWDFSLIDKIDTVLADQSEVKDQFHNWAVARMYKEVENGTDYDEYIPHIVSLQEQLVVNHPDDLYTLWIMQDAYFLSEAYDDIILLSDRIYPLIPDDQIVLLANVLTKHVYALSHKQKEEEIINLIEPNLDKLLSQPEASANTLPIIALLDAYFKSDNKKGTKQLLQKFKEAYPSIYAEEIDYINQDAPELKSFIENALK